MGYCKHEWQARSEQLREVFNGGERTVHDFYVCNRCLKIREIGKEPERRPGAPGDEGTNAA